MPSRERWDAGLWSRAAPELRERWPEAEPLRDALWRAGVTLRARDVHWTPEGMAVVAEAAQRIARRCGGDPRALLGGLVVVLESRTEPWWGLLWRLWNRKPASQRFGGYQNWGRIHIRADNVRLTAMVHEMGHFLDQKHHLSRAYRSYLIAAGLRVQTNRFEDLANALAAHVLERPLDAVRRAYLEALSWPAGDPPAGAR